ncbi:MAG TPA: hypothetical protein VKA92_15020, partial [Segetibacter sp.]|nr:hypothetical protein [Segetibacter sp.]
MNNLYSRRDVLQLMGYFGLNLISQPFSPLLIHNSSMHQRAVPSSGEMLPVIGLGTWIQFDVGTSEEERKPLRNVLKRMAE